MTIKARVIKQFCYICLCFTCLSVRVAGISKLTESFTTYIIRNPINDKDNSYTFTNSVDGQPNSSIQWSCNNKQLNFSITTPYSLYTSNIPVVYRFDNFSPSLVEQWASTTTSDSASLPALKVSGFTRRAMKASRVIFQITDGNGTKHSVKYNIFGLSKALLQLKCAKKFFF